MTYIAGHTAVENSRRLARSALPAAPVVDDQPGGRLRARLSAALRRTARWELRLAARLDRTPRWQPQPH
jgi:hypothetical protein